MLKSPQLIELPQPLGEFVAVPAEQAGADEQQRVTQSSSACHLSGKHH